MHQPDSSATAAKIDDAQDADANQGSLDHS
jgi:hypothetical protein